MNSWNEEAALAPFVCMCLCGCVPLPQCMLYVEVLKIFSHSDFPILSLQIFRVTRLVSDLIIKTQRAVGTVSVNQPDLINSIKWRSSPQKVIWLRVIVENLAVALFPPMILIYQRLEAVSHHRLISARLMALVYLVVAILDQQQMIVEGRSFVWLLPSNKESTIFDNFRRNLKITLFLKLIWLRIFTIISIKNQFSYGNFRKS